MVVVGFDVGKDSLFGARIDRSSRVREHYELANDAEQITTLLKKLQTKYKHLLLASEATAEYHRPLALVCLELGIPFRLLNPITTKQYVRATVRKRKTDKTDAEVIARVALQGEGSTVTAETFHPVKPMVRTGMKLTRMSQMLNLMQQRLEDIMPEEKLLSEQLTRCREQLEVAVGAYRERAAEYADKETEKLLCTIPGVGHITALTLIAEIGDITRFKGPKALIAYAGLDPKVRQSGYTLTRNVRLTKRGSPYLRQSVYIAATVARQWNPTMKATYDKKRAEGKRYKEATIVVARRLLNCVYAVWTKNIPYKQLEG
ncbi:MAG TPA: IS110 family transposase [Candidatus Saccharimonadales bacterium]|nr:IS110 family transposase [Candidatus Saccharimonadales bacterium]